MPDLRNPFIDPVVPAAPPATSPFLRAAPFDPAASDAADVAGGGELGRGFSSGLRSALASSKAAVGGVLEAAQGQGAGKDWLLAAKENAARAAQVAPFTESLRDIHGVGDVGRYIAGKVGEGASLLPAAVAGGALGEAAAGPAGALVGGALPFLPVEGGAALLPHIKDDGSLDAPISELGPKALGRGAAVAALSGVAPALAGRALMGARPAAGGVLAGAAKEMALETGVQAAGGAASTAVSNAIEGKQTMPGDLLEAAAGAAAGIAPIAGAAGLARARPALERAPRAPEAKEPAAPTANDSPAAWSQKLLEYKGDPFATADTTDHGRAAEALRTGLGDPTLDIQGLRARRDELNGLGAKYAEQMATDERVPAETRARVAQAAESGNLQPEWQTLSRYADQLNEPAKANEPDTAGRFGSAWQGIKDAGKSVGEALKAAKDKYAGKEDGPKFSFMDTDERSKLSDYVFQHLREDFRDDPKAIAAAKSTAYTLAKLTHFGDEPAPRDVARSVYHMLDDLVQDKEAFIKGLPTDLKKTLQALPERVTREANVGGSAFDTYISKDLTNGQRGEVARRFEQFLRGEVPDKHTDAAIKAFGDVMGGEKNVRALMDHYGDRYERKQKEQALGTDEAANLSEKDGPQATYHFAEPGTTRGFTSKQGAYDALDVLRKGDPDFAKRFEVTNMRESANDLGGIDKLHADVRGDMEKRMKEDQAHAKEPVVGPEAERFATRGDRAEGRRSFLETTAEEPKQKFLERFHLIKSSDRDTNELVASDKDLRAMRTAVEAKDVKGKPEIAAARREGSFQVEYTNGKRLTVNAESVWKAMADKGLKSQDAEGNHQYRSRLFKEGVAAILARPDVKAVHGADRADLLIDKELGLRYRSLSGSVEHGKALAERSAQFAAIDEKLKTWKEQLQDQYLPREDKDRIRQEMADMRQRNETTLNGQKDSIRQALSREVLERLDRTEAAIKEDRAIATDAYEKRDGVTNIQDEIAAQPDNKVRAFDEETGQPVTDAGGRKTTPGALQNEPTKSEGAQPTKSAKFEREQPLNDRDAVEKAARGAEATKEMDRKAAAREREKIGEKFSAQKPENGAREWSEAEKTTAKEEFHRIAGDELKVAFEKATGFSGKWDGKDTATFSTFAGDPSSVAWHEALHALFTKLSDKDSRTKLWGSLQRVADSGLVMRQLEKLLKNHPDALDQVRQDPQERLAYMFQFYRAGAMRIGPETQNVFSKIAAFVRTLTGTVSQYEQAERYMDSIYDGRFSDQSKASSVIEDLKLQTIGDKLKALAPPLTEAGGKVLTATTGRLRDTQVPALQKLADMFHLEPDRERGGRLGFLQERAMATGKFMNKAFDALNGIGKEEGLELVRALREGKSGDQRVKQLSALLDDLHGYMTDAGVKRRVGIEGDVVKYADLGYRKDYVPQVWNRDAILENPTKFMEDMTTAGVKAEDAAFIRRVVTEPAEHEAIDHSNIGFTPWNRSVNSREFNFTPEQQRALERYFDNDPISLMTTYIQQATHRAEYARSFGNAGEKIQQLMGRAKEQGATTSELQMAEAAQRGMTGTLGVDMDPKLRKITSGIIVYENAALLPFALFSSLIDPLGVTLRTGSFAEGRKAFAEGMKGLVKDMLGKTDENREMARTLGLIDEANMLEKFGDVYNGMYMSRTLKRFNDKFFRVNGMDSWNKSMRTAAMVAGERFLLKHATRPDEHSERYLRELGVEASDIKDLGDGRIDAKSEAVQRALFKFVDDAVLRPNAAHRPIWGSDPHYNLVFHLKQYTFSMQRVFHVRAAHESSYGNLVPTYALMAAIPVMDAVDMAQQIMTGASAGSAAHSILHAISRSGVLGTKNFLLDAALDPTYGGVPGQSFAGPAAQHAIYAAQTAAGAANHSAHGLLFRSLPGGQLVKGLVQ